MPSREPAMVRFNETGDCVKVGEYMVRVEKCTARWWVPSWIKHEYRLSVMSDTGGETRYWVGKRFEL